MGERMQLVRLSLPRQMVSNLKLVISMDGRPQGEIIRSVLATYIESKLVQASVLKNLNLPIPGQSSEQANSTHSPALRKKA